MTNSESSILNLGRVKRKLYLAITIRVIFITSQTARTTHMVVQLRMSHMFILASVLLAAGSAVVAAGSNY